MCSAVAWRARERCFGGSGIRSDEYDPYTDLDENGSIALMASAEVRRRKPRAVNFKTTRAGAPAPHELLVGGAGGYPHLVEAGLVEAGLVETRL
jgi:hypothetical protein